MAARFPINHHQDRRHIHINKLPVEILEHVLLMNGPLDLDDSYSSFDIDEILNSMIYSRNSSQVCSKWRKLMLENGSFWKYIVLSSSSPRLEWNRELVRRASRRNLIVYAELFKGKTLEETIEEIIGGSYLARIHVLYVTISRQLLSENFFKKLEGAAQLESLHVQLIESIGPFQIPNSEFNFSSPIPPLHRLHLQGSFGNMGLPVLKHLTHLSIAEISSPGLPLEYLLAQLAEMPALQELLIPSVPIFRQNSQLPIVAHLPCLRSLWLGTTTAELILLLQHLELSQECTVSVHFFSVTVESLKNQNSRSIVAWLQQRLNERTIHALQIRFHDTLEISIGIKAGFREFQTTLSFTSCPMKVPMVEYEWFLNETSDSMIFAPIINALQDVLLSKAIELKTSYRQSYHPSDDLIDALTYSLDSLKTLIIVDNYNDPIIRRLERHRTIMPYMTRHYQKLTIPLLQTICCFHCNFPVKEDEDLARFLGLYLWKKQMDYVTGGMIKLAYHSFLDSWPDGMCSNSAAEEAELDMNMMMVVFLNPITKMVSIVQSTLHASSLMSREDARKLAEEAVHSIYDEIKAVIRQRVEQKIAIQEKMRDDDYF